MGSGLSMTSVNKIKELAAAREYSLALEIIDSQDLSKSLNPQFLRLCGEVYIANGRYVDARRILLMAHKMAPEAKRVIYSLVDLYLRMGYKELAEFYFRLYMHDSDPSLPETIQLNYIYNKAQGCPFEEIETLLFPMYSDVMDYDWSFELYLLMRIQGKDIESENIKLDYMASFKNGTNADIIEAIEDNQKNVEEVFYIYSKEKVADDSPEQEELRVMEKPLLEDDEHKINPKEAEIQILFEDNEKISFGAKLKLKKHLKEEEKLAKKMQGESEDTPDREGQQLDEEQGAIEEIQGELEAVADEECNATPAEPKVNIFKKLFSKNKSEENDNASEEVDDVNEVEIAEKAEALIDSSEETHEEVETEAQDEKTDETLEDHNEENPVEEYEALESEEFVEEEVETAALDSAEQESLDDIGDSVMQEIYEKKKISIVTEVGEDTFINTQDGDYETGNPFDQIINQEKNNSDSETKPSFVIEEVELLAEDDEFEIDDFSQGFDMNDFDSAIQEETEYVADETSFEEEETELVADEVSFEEEETELVADEVSFEEEETELVADEVSFEKEEMKPSAEEVSFEEEEIEPVSDEVSYEEEEIESVVEEAYVEEDVFKPSINPLEGESVYNTLQQKGKLDYPEFKSSLFPELGESVASVENNFNEIMTEAQDKIYENLLKEEQMQREAEALLASLGIDLDFSKSATSPSDNSMTQSGAVNITQNNIVAEESNVSVPAEVEEQISDEVFETVEKYCPSRDELKASLKIDSVKKNILKQIKEYR
ncbi:MAG: hypothetical protein E7257_07540 [Lachnospiraceae bacterium]|nr:hypothetical protein [Lachnospiraceae bacterium]